MIRSLIAALFAASALAEAPKFDTVLYGASYYHEYMPYERLEKDVELMQKAGVTVIRLGESTWSSWEPQDGRFEFAWMDRVIDRLHKVGIKIIFGTPTYSIPPWMYKKHPEILVTRLGGQKATYGIRQNMDITHPRYLFYPERVIRRLLAHYRDHPAIIGWQIDNETTAYGTAGPNVQRAFVDYLRGRYGTVAALNKAWGLTYWGQLLNDWDELPPADGAINPGYKLEWQRYQQKIATDYLAWQARIVREYKRPHQFITHNFVGGVRTDIDQFAIAQHLDIAAVNPYHAVQDQLDGHAISLSGDLCRSLKNANYLITETNAQSIGWDSKEQFPPWDGQLRLNAYSHLASGSNMVAYWHWHSLHYGQETYWKGVLGHDLEPNRIYAEASRVGNEWKKVGPRLANFRRRNDVALLYSIDSHHGIQFMPFHDRVNYMTVLTQMHRALYNLNVGTDFVFPDSTNFADYRVLVVPPLYVASDRLLNRLSDFVKRGGHLVMAFKSGFTDEHDTVRSTRMPGPLRGAAGFSYQEFSTLRQPVALKGDPYKAGDANIVSIWAEFLLPETAQPLAFYDHPAFARYPALTRNKFGDGTLTYEGTYLSDELQSRVLAEVIGLAGLAGPDQRLPTPVRVKHGMGNAGHRMYWFLNYSGQTQTVPYSYENGTDVLTGRNAAKSATLAIPAWDLVIIEESR
ncbi:MAG TPA: beta-galactosidase [Bryobacteraceae bacterium]|nr:beta-galactosidase [Bryobacteraceae bacterium]